MSKATKTDRPSTGPKVSPEEANNSLMVGAKNQVPIEDIFDAFEKVKDGDFAEVTGNYLELDKTGTYDFIFTGMDKMSATVGGETKMIDCVRLTDRNKNSFVFASVVVVNACRKMTQVPCFIRLKYKGDVQGANGKYKDISVMTLPSNLK